MKKILVLEDDRELNQSLCYALGEEGYICKSAYSLKEAQELHTREFADLILLDVNLPDGEGFAFCAQVRREADVPMIFLTARDLEEDMIRGYELGADDYITKPFSVKVLLKKIEAILKRAQSATKNYYEDGFLRIDFDRARVEVSGEVCVVTPTEFRMLRLFTEHPGQLMTYSIMLDHLWEEGGQFVDRHALAVNVNRLRGKIEDETHKYISNVYGMGYQWLR